MKKNLLILLTLISSFSSVAQTLDDIIEPAANKQNTKIEKKETINKNSYPTNFNDTDFENITDFNQKVLSFDIEILRLEKSPKNTPYYLGQIGNRKIWIFSMIKSDLIKVGEKVRVIGYLVSTQEIPSDINSDKFQLLSFGVFNPKNKKLDYFPGSEMQMKEWKEGKIPSSGN